MIVADVFGADWNFVGNKLAHYIQTTTKNGMIVDGGVYWLERIAETGMQAYYKNSFPTQGMRVMVTGINIPVRIGKTLVMPGDVVLADREGMWFIPPHMVKDVVESGELSKARDDWSLMMLSTREVHVPPDLRAADAGTAEGTRRVHLQEDRPQTHAARPVRGEGRVRILYFAARVHFQPYFLQKTCLASSSPHLRSDLVEPIRHDDDRRPRKARDVLDEEKAAAVVGHVVIAGRVDEIMACREQRNRRSTVEAAARLNRHRHQRSLGIDEKQFPFIARPQWVALRR